MIESIAVQSVSSGRLRRVFLAAVGDANDPSTWSGIPFHFLQEAKRQNLVDEGLPLDVCRHKWSLRRYYWNSLRVLRGESPGGYQYSVEFLEALWKPFHRKIRENITINCFQLYPPSIVNEKSVEKWFYIDMTLRQLFDFYKIRKLVGKKIAREALYREKEGYLSARGVITHSRWAAANVVSEYGVARDRVHVAVPGANIDSDEYATWEQSRKRSSVFTSSVPMKLVFVGKNWKRKGLDRLLEALIVARRKGLVASLRVIGCERHQLPVKYQNLEEVYWCGFIDKRAEARYFASTVSECDVGCLLSRAEAGGMVLREYQAFGLITLGPAVGGAPEHMTEGASIAINPEAGESEIADVLLHLQSDTAHFIQLRANAWKQRHIALWKNSVEEILSFWPASEFA